MIVPDVNLLIHAYNMQFPQHPRAKAWWEARLTGPEGVALPWVVVLGFLRLMTNRHVFENPFTPEEVLTMIEEWLDLSHFTLIEPGANHFQRLKRMVQATGTAGHLTTDAHIAAVAVDRGLVLHSCDADFSRFPGLKWVNPLQTA